MQNALDEPTSKNISLAFRMLASVAGGQEPHPIGRTLFNDQLRETVRRSIHNWNHLSVVARSQLNELMLSIEDDDDAALHAATSLQGLALLSDGAAKYLAHALALRSIAVSPKILTAYGELLDEAENDELSFQRFFEAHPLVLDARAFQVWGKPDFHGHLEPDFVIRTYDNKYIVVEIETPAKQLVTQQRQLSAHVTHAVSQVLHSREYLRTHLEAASQVFPHFSPPSGLVVVGRESVLSDEQKTILRSENAGRSDIQIVGFDTLADTARAVTNNIVHGIRGATTGTRLQ